MAENHCNSYYAATANPTARFERLEGSIDVDVAIVGGGFTGIATALELAERGVKVAVLEANGVGWGASGRNGGQITGSLPGDRAMEKQFRRALGDEAAEFIWNLRWRGHDIIRKRVAKYGIRCDLKHGHMHAAFRTSHIAELEQMYDAACAHGMGDEVELVHGPAVRSIVGTDIYQAGLINLRNMHVHPLNLCLGEADAARRLGVRILADSRVTSIRYGSRPELFTERGHVRADKVLLAGNTHHGLARFRLGGLLFPDRSAS
jgi:glycine/D-amino acid oxidase-like deaminating enzyme